ncbi:hypothetical protein A5671_20320 [Mycolicibacter heraklionensis]|nr:hypothetical protein A5671_20320 [Mycolicibacter heraklionensis]
MVVATGVLGPTGSLWAMGWLWVRSLRAVLVDSAGSALIASEVATVVIAIPITMVIVVAFVLLPVHAPRRVPDLTGTPVVGRHRCRQGLDLGGDTEAGQPRTCGNGKGGSGNSAERFHAVGYSRVTHHRNA